MLKFANDSVREIFHSLPLEKQQEWHDFATAQLKRKFFVTILYIENSTNTLEVSIRIDQ